MKIRIQTNTIPKVRPTWNFSQFEGDEYDFEIVIKRFYI